MAAAALRSLLSQAYARAERRLPALTRLKAPEPLPIALHRRRIYIVPTRFGLGFGAILATMLLGALNYTNNAALLLTCLLAAAAFNSMLLAFRALDGLALRTVRPGHAFAGTALPVDLGFAAGSRARAGLRIDAAGETQFFAIEANAETEVRIELATDKRGPLPLPRLRVSTTWPFGLFRAWSWLSPDTRALVYPRPEAHGPAAPGADSDGERVQGGAAGDALAGLREYRAGDPLKLVAWKASARHANLLVKEFERPRERDERRLDWHAIRGLSHEARIARLARWVLEAHAANARWTLVLPAETLGPDAGIGHYHRCLAALALLP